MKTPKGQIAREGRVSFGDASISINEEGIPRDWDLRAKWELKFKRQVFTRVVQSLNKLGWTCVVPPKEEKQNSASFALHFRNCSKGDLKGELEIMGRRITFKMWQGVNTPTRADYGGKYECDLEGCMPYVLRLEMERTRRRIRDYLCNVFTGYEFDTKHYSGYSRTESCGFFGRTALEKVQQHHAESCHYKGGDWVEYLAKNHGLPYNRKSADGVMLDHGMPIWFTDSKGRICPGTAYYNINNMWWVVSGRYSYTNKACCELFAQQPEGLRVKRNQSLRRKRLEREMSKATAAMKFERAAVLRDILFPPEKEVFLILHKEYDSYFGPCYSGYTKDTNAAGRYTRDELKPYLGDKLDVSKFKAVRISVEAA